MVTGIEIKPDAWYDTPAIRRNLKITEHAIKAARDSGKLRFTKAGKKYLHRGDWVLDWLNGESAK